MNMTPLSAHYPVWFQLAIVGTFVYPAVALVLIRRIADLRLALALPVIANTALSCVGLFNVVRGLSFTGRAPRATAAGLAESLLPLALGCFVATFLAIVAAIRFRHLEAAGRWLPYAGIVLFASASLLLCQLLLVHHIKVVATYSTSLERAVGALMAAETALTVVAVGVLLLTAPRNRPKYVHARAWLIVFAVCTVAGGAGVVVLINSLRRIAIDGA